MNQHGSPFHAGERAIQELEGVRDRIEQVGRKIIRDHLPVQHQEFFTGLPFLVAAGLDETDRPWATLLTGEPGFASARDSRTLDVHALPSAEIRCSEASNRERPSGSSGSSSRLGAATV